MYEEGSDDVFDLERRWIRRVQQDGHEESANKLVNKFYKEIFSYTYKQVFDQQLAMDLTQEIFIRALKSISHFDEHKASFRTWLYQISSHHCTDYFRSKAFLVRKYTDFVEDIEHEGEDVVMQQFMQKEHLKQIKQVLATFEEQEQQIMIGKLLEDMTFLEIAEKLQIPLSTVKTKYYKSIKKLKLELEVNAR